MPRTVPLCGNSIGTDRRFLTAYLPEIEEYLHYRSVDVSSIKELVRRWYPDVLAQRGWKAGTHRALDDIRESVSELQLYRELVFSTPDVVARTARRQRASMRRRANCVEQRRRHVDARRRRHRVRRARRARRARRRRSGRPGPTRSWCASPTARSTVPTRCSGRADTPTRVAAEPEILGLEYAGVVAASAIG